MQELKKILKEIDETKERYGENPYIDEKVTDLCYGMNITKGIIRKYISGKDTDVPAKDGWIPVEERLPEDNKPVLIFAESTTISSGTITMVGACHNGFWFIQNGEDTLGFPVREYKVNY